MAQKDQATIFHRAAHVDLVVGPGQLARLPALLAAVAADRRPRLEVGLGPRAARRGSEKGSFARFDPRPALRRDPALREVPHQAMVRIMLGCDKFCTYCIVPRVRGPEHNRPAAEILDEVRRLVDRRLPGSDAAGPDGQQLPGPQRRPDRFGWPTCWQRLDGIEGLRRLKFVTNHPRHMTVELLAGGPRSAQGFALSARARPERLEPRAPADAAGLYGGELPGNDRADPRGSCPAPR